MNNRNLLIIAVVLLGISILSYNRSQTRAERFERGQKFLSQLNADNIVGIEINKDKDTVHLRKSEDQFLVTSQHNYPAKNDSMNRFINDVLSIELEKEVGSSDELAKELELTEDSAKCLRIVLKDDSGKEMVRFHVGKASDDGRGNYVKRMDGEDQKIYLSSKGVYLSSTADNFLQKDLLDVAADQITAIKGKDFTITEADGSLKLENLPSGKKESSDVSQVTGMLSGLRFENVFLADDDTVGGIPFGAPITVALKDNSSYLIQVGKKGEDHFLRLQGSYDMSKLENLRVNQEDTQEDLKEKSKLLNRHDEIQEFNQFHGSWVYKISEFTAKKFLKSKSDLIEDEKKES